MSVPPRRNERPPARRRRLVGLRLLRSLVTTAVLITLYGVLPLDNVRNVLVTLLVGLAILVAVTAWQVRAVAKSRYPAVRAVEALATTVPLFLLLFASAYFTMANTSTANFNTHPLTRIDALYFTMAVFSTVGFGDIVAVSQLARFVVVVQIVLDLLALGLGVRAFAGAVQRARRQADGAADPDPPSEQP